MKIGPHKNTDARYYTLKKLYWSPKIKILGITITANLTDLTGTNFEPVFQKAKVILNSWSSRSLNLMGKIAVVNSLINSLYIHLLLALPSPPGDFFMRHKRLVTEYLWGNKPHKIAYSKLIQNDENMGLKLHDLEQKNSALKAAWPIRWAEKDPLELDWFYSFLPIKDNRMQH